MEERTYKFKKSEGLLGNKAKIYGAELARIQQENNGVLTPQEVVEQARDVKNPLHNCFDWNNTSAAEQWRLQQARQLITSISIVVSYNGKQEEIDAFVNVTRQEKVAGANNQIYLDIHTAMNNETFKKEVVMNAWNELMHWQNKYQQFKEFSAVFNAMKQVKLKIVKEKPKKLKKLKQIPQYA